MWSHMTASPSPAVFSGKNAKNCSVTGVRLSDRRAPGFHPLPGAPTRLASSRKMEVLPPLSGFHQFFASGSAGFCKNFVSRYSCNRNNWLYVCSLT